MRKLFKFSTAVFGVCVGLGVAISKVEQLKNKKGWVEGHKAGFYERELKRPLDFGLSLMGLLFLWPVMVAVGVLVRIKLGKPVLFKQERPGLGGEIFTMLKYRTMTDQRDDNGELLPDGDRLPKFGELLRKASVDELPELFNILRGDMSIIGPRPLLVRYLPRYNERQKHRHDVRPGLTGMAQVSGRNLITWEDKLEDDAQYVEKVTFLGDMKIFFKTMAVIFKHSEVSVDIPEFMGTGD